MISCCEPEKACRPRLRLPPTHAHQEVLEGLRDVVDAFPQVQVGCYPAAEPVGRRRLPPSFGLGTSLSSRRAGVCCFGYALRVGLGQLRGRVAARGVGSAESAQRVSVEAVSASVEESRRRNRWRASHSTLVSLELSASIVACIGIAHPRGEDKGLSQSRIGRRARRQRGERSGRIEVEHPLGWIGRFSARAM